MAGIEFQNIAFRKACNPVDAASGAITPVSLDTRTVQANYIGILIAIGNITAASTVFEVKESADDSSYSSITGLAFTALSGTSDNTLYCGGFPLGGVRKRYFQLQATFSGTALISAQWLCMRLNQTPSTATERGVVEQLFIAS